MNKSVVMVDGSDPILWAPVLRPQARQTATLLTLAGVCQKKWTVWFHQEHGSWSDRSTDSCQSINHIRTAVF